MTQLFAALAALTAVVAAVRSTWSPCGISMLSSITPLAERGRGHRWGATATWYLAGAVAGGASLGALLAAGAAAVHAAAPADDVLAVIACALGLLAAASDAGPVPLPVHHRQVNERWLDHYRPWVYASGFGWQIGTGLATYIRTSAVYLLVALGVFSGRPVAAFAAGLLFGTVRGLAVYAAGGITTTAALASFHRRFTEVGRAVLAVTVGTELVVAIILGWAVSPWAALVVVGAGALGAIAVAVARRVHLRRTGVATSPGGSRSARTA